MANDRLVSALKARFASPQAALRHLGLSERLLEGTAVPMSHTAAIAAIAALKKRGLIAQDTSNEEAENVLRNSTEGDRNMPRPARDTRRTPRMGDAEMAEREREESTRDAMRRAADAETLDPDELKDMIEVLAENYPEVLSEMQHEMAADRRGPKGWSRDRAERRSAADSLRAKDTMRAMKARKFGANDNPVPFPGMPQTGGSMYGTPAEDKRGRAHDIAMDRGDSLDAFASWLPGAAQIGKI
jgi:hypothetical protein